MSRERKSHQGSMCFSGPIVNLTLVTSDVSLMYMHVQNLFCNDYSVTRFSYLKLTFLTRNSLFLLETHFFNSKLTFLTRNSLFLPETHFLTRNSLFLLETHFSYSKLTFLTRNSLFLLETHFSYSKFCKVLSTGESCIYKSERAYRFSWTQQEG